MIFDRFNPEIYPESIRRRYFSVTVTDIYHYETELNESHALNSAGFEPYEDKNKAADDLDYRGDTGSNFNHGKAVKGIRTDFQNTPLVNILIPTKHSGHVPLINVGDTLVVTMNEDTTKPIYVGSVHTKTTNWSDAIKNLERPVLPSLEMRGSSGEIMTYNPIYLTFHESYEPTGQHFGDKEDQIWYDRFVLFESSDIYRNKKNLVDYNSWIKKAYENKEAGAETIIKVIENTNDVKYMDRFFYLKDNNYPYRPDPTFDVYASFHQQNSSAAVAKSETGVDFKFDSISEGTFDKYPVTKPHLNLSQEKLFYTAFDETINLKLSKTRQNAKLRNKEFRERSFMLQGQDFVPDLKNKNVPFEPMESREIRIGRNKLILSDIYGTGKQLFSTFKTAKDQGLTMIAHEESNLNVSQVRLRGSLGESLLIESIENDFSRINLKGVSGHIFEMYDDENEKNYLYMLTSDSNQMDQSWGLSRSSYLMVANRNLISGGRIHNNPAVTHYDGRASRPGRYTVRGVYDGASHAYNALLLDPALQAYTENWTHFGGIFVHDVRRALTGDANGFHRAQKGGKFVQYTYSADALRWQLHNLKDTNIEIFDKDVIIRTAPTGTAQFWAPDGVVDVRGDKGVLIGSCGVCGGSVTIKSPVTYLGDSSGSKLVVRDQDEVTVTVEISVEKVLQAVFAGIPIVVTATGTVKASEGPARVIGSSVSASVQGEFNLEGGGI